MAARVIKIFFIFLLVLNLTCAACNCCVTLYKSGAKVSLWGAKNQNSPFSFSEKGLFYRDKSRNQGKKQFYLRLFSIASRLAL
jgi:hypothetical protein